MQKSFKDILKNHHQKYEKWKPFFCKLLDTTIHFNSKGFNHLRFRISNTPRNQKEVLYKISLLPLVRPVLRKATSIEKYEKRYLSLNGSRNGKRRLVEYWSFVAAVGKQRTYIRVVVRKVDTGSVHFWSVMKL